VEDAVRPVLV
jgi:hypothetical protein